MDPSYYLIGLRYPEGLGSVLIEHLLDPADLDEMVPRPQSAQLTRAPFLCPMRNLVGVGLFHTATLLHVLRVAIPSETLVYGPLDAFNYRIV